MILTLAIYGLGVSLAVLILASIAIAILSKTDWWMGKE
jgi:hypothetical protein